MGGINFSNSSARQKFPSWTAPLTRYSFTGQVPGGVDPNGVGLMSDALAGNYALLGPQAFAGLADQIPGGQLAGHQAQQLGAAATQQGYDNLMALGGHGWNTLNAVNGLAGLVPNGLEASNYYLNRGVTPAMQGANVQGATGAGQQLVDYALSGAGSRVVDAALAAPAQFQTDIYNRALKDALPTVTASYSSRGLGTSGAAARGEQDFTQRLTDQFAQEAIQNRLAALGVAAQAQNGVFSGAGAGAGAAASQAIGAQNAAVARGQLGLGAANAIPGQLGGFQEVAGAPLGYMGQFAGLQGAPLDLVGQGLNLYGQGMQLPFQYQQALYNFTRQPQLDLLTQLSGTQQSNARNWSFGGKSGGGTSVGIQAGGGTN